MSDKIEEINVLEALKEMEKSREWIRRHYDELRADYEGKVFVVKDGKVICASTDIEELLKDIEEKGEDPTFLFMESIPPKDISFIL